MLVVNIFGAPGAGKSTYAARLYAELKMIGVETELVREVAKQYVYDGTLQHKPQREILHAAIEQIENLHSSVEVVVSDSPVLLSLVYDNKLGETETKRSAKRYHYARPSVNIMLSLGDIDDYNTRGRVHSYSESSKIEDRIIREIRDETIGVFYQTTHLQASMDTVASMASKIEHQLEFELLYSRAVK